LEKGILILVDNGCNRLDQLKPKKFVFTLYPHLTPCRLAETPKAQAHVVADMCASQKARSAILQLRQRRRAIISGEEDVAIQLF
jgi:hypothetical protein